MTKVVKIIENNLITGVQYGTVEIPDTPIVITKSHKKPIQQKTAHPTVATQQAPKIKQPARSWLNKISATKKQLQEQRRTKQK